MVNWPSFDHDYYDATIDQISLDWIIIFVNHDDHTDDNNHKLTDQLILTMEYLMEREMGIKLTK